MGTKPKKRAAPIPFDLSTAIKKVGPRALPKDPEMLQRIVIALMRKTKSREATRISVILRILAAIEQMRAGTPWPEELAVLYLTQYHIPTEELDKLSASVLDELSRPNTSKQEHLGITLHVQRHFLLHFMQEHKYQDYADSPQEEWFIKTYGDHLFTMLCAFPCLCSYRGTLKETLYPIDESGRLSEYDEVRTKHLAPLVQTIYYLLARLHQMSTSQVKALLKKSPASGTAAFFS